MEAYIKEATSVYAALLSTLLAIRAIYINRLRVYADLHIDKDYRLYISNLSPAPIIVTDYQFLWDNTPNNFNKYDIDYGGYTLILPNNYSNNYIIRKQ